MAIFCERSAGPSSTRQLIAADGGVWLATHSVTRYRQQRQNQPCAQRTAQRRRRTCQGRCAALVQLQEGDGADDERVAAQPACVHLVHLPLLQVELQDGHERSQRRPRLKVRANEGDSVEAVSLAEADVKLEAIGHDDELHDRHLGLVHHLRAVPSCTAHLRTWRGACAHGIAFEHDKRKSGFLLLLIEHMRHDRKHECEELCAKQ